MSTNSKYYGMGAALDAEIERGRDAMLAGWDDEDLIIECAAEGEDRLREEAEASMACYFDGVGMPDADSDDPEEREAAAAMDRWIVARAEATKDEADQLLADRAMEQA